MALKRSHRCGSSATEFMPRAGASPADTRPPCFEVEKHALRLRASTHYLPTNLVPSHLRTGFLSTM